MERSIFDTVVGKSIPSSEAKQSLLNTVVVNREMLNEDNPKAAGRWGFGDSSYDLGVTYSNLPELENIRAASQSRLEQLGNMANQAVVGQILGAGMEGIGYLVDPRQWINAIAGTEQEYGNWLTQAGADLQTWTEEATPIYQRSDAAKFDPTSWSWWMANGKSIVSTLSLAIPAAAAVRGIETAGKAIGLLDEAANVARKTARLMAGGVDEITAAAKATQGLKNVQWGARGISEAIFSRHMEDMQEGRQSYEQVYQDSLNKGVPEVEARKLAAKAAADTYKWDAAMLIQDIPQYLLLNMSFNPLKGLEKIAEKSIRATAMMGKNVAPVIASKGALIAADMIGEGFEEGYQYIVQQEATRLAEKLQHPEDKTSFDERFNGYMKDGNFWTNAFFGAVGAGVMQTAGKVINEAIVGTNPKVKFLNDFGSTVSHAADSMKRAAVVGAESAHNSALVNLENTIFSKAMILDQMDDAKEMIKRTANPTPEDTKKFGINEEDIKTLGLNQEELLKDADEYAKRWEDNIAKHIDIDKAANVTRHEFIINKFNKLKQDYSSKVNALQSDITNYYSLSSDAQQIFDLSNTARSIQKNIDMQTKLLENPDMGKFEKKHTQKLIDRATKRLNGITKQIDTIEGLRTEEERKADDLVDIGGPKNLLNVSDDEIKDHKILEYRKWQDALEFADATLTSSQNELSRLTSSKKEPKTATETKEQHDITQEDKDIVPEPDDNVIYTQEGKEYEGKVDTIDENGNYVIIPTDKTIGDKPAIVNKDDVKINNKGTAGADINTEVGDTDEIPTKNEMVNAGGPAVDISYMFGKTDNKGNYIGSPEVTNEDLHKFLINPANKLDGHTAELFIDSESNPYVIKWFKDHKIDPKSITIESLTTEIIDNMPIGIKLVKDGKVAFKDGMFYHTSSFGDIVELRATRKYILENLLKGFRVYSDTLTKSNGHFNNNRTSKGNILERLGLKINELKLAVSRLNGKVYMSQSDTVPGVGSENPGGVFAPTRKTPNGTTIWARISPSKLTREHAEILWDALVTRYSRGKGGYMAPFPDSRVDGLTVGEVINMLALMGERKTNIDHPNYVGTKNEALRSKTLYIHNGRQLTFGTATVDIFEDNLTGNNNNRDLFIKWAMNNKNYAVPFGISSMGVELNSPFKRTFKLGSWSNNAEDNKTYAQFLASSPVDGKGKFALESDLQEYAGSGSVMVRPHLSLGSTAADIKVGKSVELHNQSTDNAADSKTSRVRESIVSRLMSTGRISSAYDIIYAPVGSFIYYEVPIIEGGQDTGKKEIIPVASIVSDPKLGPIFDTSTPTETFPNGFPNARLRDLYRGVPTTELFVKDFDNLLTALRNKSAVDNLLIKLPDHEETIKPAEQVEKPKSVEPTQTAPEDNEVPPDEITIDDLESFLDIPTMEVWDGEIESIVNLPKELKWLHEKFGKQHVKETNTLINIAKTGRKAFALFTSDCIYVYEGAPEGALYHEAFHRLLLGYLSEADRKAIYKSARKEYKMPDASEHELSERLAEDFRAYKLTGVKPKSRTIWQKFKDLLSFIYTYFTGNTKLTSFNIDKLYDSIERGQFKYSTITRENAKILDGIQAPMQVEIHHKVVPGINNYHDLDKLVKYMTSVFVKTNEIDDLNDFKNATVKMSKMFDYLDNEDKKNLGLIQKLRFAVSNGQKQLDSGKLTKDKIEEITKRVAIAGSLADALTIATSKDYRGLFVGKISDMLLKLNVKRVVDEDVISESFITDDGYRIYDKASYEINSKDNILASIKFLVATLPDTPGLSTNLAIPDMVDFGKMWNSLMHNLWNIRDERDMMKRLNALTHIYPYARLVEKLNVDKSGFLKQQLRQSVQRHKHDFVNFLVNYKQGKDPIVDVRDAATSKASEIKVYDWSLFFYCSPIVDRKPDGLSINKTAIDSITSTYKDITSRINKEYAKTSTLADPDSILNEFTDLLNSTGIHVDKDSVDELVKSREGDTYEYKLYQTINADFDHIFKKISIINVSEAVSVFSDEKAVRKLSEAYVNTHPEEISDSIIGPSNNLYYVYSQHSYVTDKILKMKDDPSILTDLMSATYGDGSYYMDQLTTNPDILKDLSIQTFAMMGKRSSTGSDYLNINQIEDYIFKLAAYSNGIIPFPTLADRRTFYLLKGITPYKFEYKVDEAGNLILPDSVVDIFIKYARAEKNRIEKAEDLIRTYDAAKELLASYPSEKSYAERVEQIERQLIENYHYVMRGEIKDTTKGSALKYHHFYSLNERRKDPNFDFDTEIRKIVTDALLKNIDEELQHAEDLGVITSGNYGYYNNFIDDKTLKENSDKYGSVDKGIRNIIAANFVNSTMTSIEVEKIFSGDPAFYKTGKDSGRVHEDRVKRLTVLAATGDNFADSVEEQQLEDPTYNTATFATQKFASAYYDNMREWHTDAYIKQLTRYYEEEGEEKSDAEILSEAKNIAADRLSKYSQLDPTDGQIWISPEMYRSLSIRLGEWSNRKNAAFNLLQLDRELTDKEEQQVLEVTFQPLKLVHFDLTREGDLAIPVYDKASFATIFRTMATGKYGDRQIADMLNRMELKGKYADSNLQKIDMFKMDSAVKVGIHKKTNALDEAGEYMTDLAKSEVFSQKYSGLRRQIVTDTHDVERVKTGTQFLKIALSNLNLDEEVYMLDGKAVNGTTIANNVFKSLGALSTKGKEELIRRIGYENGKINKAKFIKMLAEDAAKSDSPDNLVDALTTVGDDFYLNLDALTEHKWIQNRLVSMIAKYAVDINLPANQFIQFSNFGIRSVNKNYKFEEELSKKDKHIEWIKNGTDDLKWIRLENGRVVPMGCIISINLFKHVIPHYSELSFEQKMDYLRYNPELLGYRIPTQGHNSIVMLKVAGVYPETIGDTVTLPSEFTTLTGSDFDIDKLYVTRYNYDIDQENRKLRKIKFIDGDTNDEEILRKIYKERFGNRLSNWNWINDKKDRDPLKVGEVTQLDAMAETTDDKAVEDATTSVIARGIYTDATIEILKEYVNSLPKSEEGWVKENKGKSIYDINSKKAVENRLLDNYFAIMKSEEHFTETSSPLGSLADILKRKAEAVRNSYEQDRPDLYYASTRYNSYVKDIYTTGKNGVGPFALNNNHHVLSQIAGLLMNNSFDEVMYEKNHYIDLSKSIGKDKVSILNWLSTLIDAHVDVAKDPYIADLNVNSYTYNVVALLLRGGVGEKTFDFVSQPILKELAREHSLSYSRNGSPVLTKRLSIDTGEVDSEGQPKIIYGVKAIDYIKHKWESQLTEDELKEAYAIPYSKVFSDGLFKDATTSDRNSKAFIKRQVAVLKAFTMLRDMGNDLNTLIQASQIDTKKFGTSIVSIRAFINKIRKVYELQDGHRFTNLEKILPYDPTTLTKINVEGANFLGDYATNSMTFALDLLGDLSIYGTEVFGQLFDHLMKITGNSYNTDEKFINVLSDEIFSAMISKFFTGKEFANIDSAKLSQMFTEIIHGIGVIRINEGGKYDSFKDNAFLNFLYLQPSKDTILPFDYFIAIPNKSGKEKMDKDSLINSFKELLKSDDPEVSALARRLFYYSFFTSGFRNRIYSFFNLMPNEIMKELVKYPGEDRMRLFDPESPAKNLSKSYNDMISGLLSSTKDIMNVTDYMHIIDEVQINNHGNDSIIKYVKLTDVDEFFNTYKGKNYNQPVGMVLNARVANTMVVGYNEDHRPIFRPYVKVENDKLGHVLMRYIGYLANNIEKDGKVNSIVNPVYIAENMRGYESRGTVLREFGMDKSIIDAYNKIKVVDDEEAFMKEIGKNATHVVHIPREEQNIIYGVSVEQINEGGTENGMQEEGQGEEEEVNTAGSVAQMELNFEEDYPFLSNDANTVFSTEKPGVRALVDQLGIVNWESVTDEQWKLLREEYEHCNI
jgi:hypothetical protein